MTFKQQNTLKGTIYPSWKHIEFRTSYPTLNLSNCMSFRTDNKLFHIIVDQAAGCISEMVVSLKRCKVATGKKEKEKMSGRKE